jgi:hypothetical protein
VFSISRAKGKTGVDSCGCDQSIGELNAVGESVLFDEGGGGSADGFGKGQDSELELAKRLPDLARLQLGSGALKKFHKGDYGQRAIRCGVDGAGRLFAAAGRPDENIGIEHHFDFRERSGFPMPVCARTRRGSRKLRR